jgi:phenylpyruvate tautomerase PptA (4-oxalocrotonate tautomerase family)
MPSYIVTCEEGRLTGSQKSQIAEAVTRAHGDSTGAPYYFVRLTFNEVKPGNYFLGGTQLDGDEIFVHGTIREGRPKDMKVEFGRVLPLHGREAEWSAALPEAEKARLENIGLCKARQK